MKQLVSFLFFLIIGMANTQAETSQHKVTATVDFGYSNPFVFMENGVTFALYPDGELDFYISNRLQVNTGVPIVHSAITLNSGFNYSPFVQYDDFGAIIQVENIPVFYDYYGRVNRVGGIRVYYRNGLLYRLGGMRIYYDSRGYYNRHVGYINPYNGVYVYRPFHRYFIRPAAGFCMVYSNPYRRYYAPVRYTYYHPYRNNARRVYAGAGHTHYYRHRAERSGIYNNDLRVTARKPLNTERDRPRRSQSTSKNSYLRSSKSVNSFRSSTRSASRNTVVSNERNSRSTAISSARRVKAQENSRARNKGVSQSNGQKKANVQKRAMRTVKTSPEDKTRKSNVVHNRNRSRYEGKSAAVKRTRTNRSTRARSLGSMK